jgi:hypothetical protein
MRRLAGRRRATVAILVAVATITAAGARAQEPPPAAEQARQAFERALVLMEEERWEPAVAELEVSLQLRSTQVALFNLALCLRQLHRVREAIAQLERFEQEFGGQATAERLAAVAEELRSLRSLPGRARVEVNVAGAAVAVDGRILGTSPLPEPIDPPEGRHTFEAHAAGREAARQEVEVLPGEVVVAHLVLPERAPDPPEPAVTPTRPAPFPRGPTDRQSGLRPVWFWSAAGLTAAAAISTAVLGTLVVTADASYEADEGRTSADQDAGKRLVLYTDVSLGIAVGAAVGAVVLYALTDFGGDGDRAASMLAPALAFSGAGPVAGALGRF